MEFEASDITMANVIKHDQAARAAKGKAQVKKPPSKAARERQIEKEFVPEEKEPEKKEAQVFSVETSVSKFSDLAINDKLK